MPGSRPNPYQSPRSDQKAIRSRKRRIGYAAVLLASAIVGALLGIFDPAPKILDALWCAYVVTVSVLLALLFGLALYFRTRKS